LNWAMAEAADDDFNSGEEEEQENNEEEEEREPDPEEDAAASGVASSQLRKRRELGEDTWPYDTPTVCVEVTSIDGQAILYVHQGVLDTIPYFYAQQARWTKAEERLRLQLPDGTPLKSFVLLMKHLYCPLQHVSFRDVTEGIHITKVAAMLNCDQKTTAAFAVALRSALRTEGDVELLHELCMPHDLPLEIQRLNKKPRLQHNELSIPELKMMLHNAAKQRDAETLEYVARHLKQRSRRGGTALEEVAKLLIGESELAAVPLTLQFLSVHPRYYILFVQEWRAIAKKFRDDSPTQRAARLQGRIDFMNLGVKLFSEGSVCEEALIRSFQLLLQHFHRRMLAVLAAVLREVDVNVQLKILENVLDPPQDFYRRSPLHSIFFGFECHRDPHIAAAEHMLHVDIIAALAVEAKAAFLERILKLGDNEFAKAITVPVLRALGSDHGVRICERLLKMDLDDESCPLPSILTCDVLELLGTPGMRKLLPVACVLKAPVKSRILESTAPVIDEDSEEGF